MSYVLCAREKTAELPPQYYTGRAGMDWLSLDRGNSFFYATKKAADWKAIHFNKFEKVHGYSFVVVKMVGVV
jgi:hypothetical protein